MSWWDDFTQGAADAPQMADVNKQNELAAALEDNKSVPGGSYNPFTDYHPVDDPSATGRGTWVDDKGSWGYSNSDEWMKNMGTGPGGLVHEAAPYVGALAAASAGLPISMMSMAANGMGFETNPLKLAGLLASHPSAPNQASASASPAIDYQAGFGGVGQGYGPGEDIFGGATATVGGTPTPVVGSPSAGYTYRRGEIPDYTGGFGVHG